MFSNWTLSSKLMAAFMTITAILLVVGGIGLNSVSNLDHKADEMIETAPLIESAGKMSYAVGRDMQMIMEMLAAEDVTGLDEVWQEHINFVKLFDQYGEMILQGGDINGDKYYEAKNSSLKDIVHRAERMHNDQFGPAVQGVYDAKKRLFQLEKDLETSMVKMEEAVGAVNETAELLEEKVNDEITYKRKKGESISDIVDKEFTWANSAMEVIIVMSNSRIAIEEYAQAGSVEEAEEFKREYQATLKEFDVWIQALLNGGQTEQGFVAAVDDAHLRGLVEKLDVIHDGAFQDSVTNFMNAFVERQTVSDQLGAADEKADGLGEQMIGVLKGIEQKAKAEMRQEIKDAHEIARLANIESIIGLVVGFILALILGITIARSLTKSINQVVEKLTAGSRQLNGAAGQVSSSSQTIAGGASEQASSLEETSASLEEISASVTNNTENANQANTQSKEARTSAENGYQAIKRLNEVIERIKVSSDETAKIIKTIDEIAFQTNLLALNAAVEAARAGDAGKGFSVVAEEVRNLASRSAQASKNTAELLEEAQNNADQGVRVSEEVEGQLKEIVDRIQKVTQLVDDVTNSTNEQASGLQQVNVAISQMDKVTQSNAANAEETAAASEELSAQAEEIDHMVDNLRDIVQGQNGGNNGHVETPSFNQHHNDRHDFEQAA